MTRGYECGIRGQGCSIHAGEWEGRERPVVRGRREVRGEVGDAGHWFLLSSKRKGPPRRAFSGTFTGEESFLSPYY